MFLRLQCLVRQPAIAASLIVTTLLIGIQKTGVLQPFELKVFDQMTQRQAQQSPDARLLVVAVTEQDLQTLGQFPLSDQVLAQVLTKLERDRPRVVGVDIFRDLPVEPGHQVLQRQINDRTIVICKHESSDNPAVSALPGLATRQIGFSDIVEDSDGVIRRNLLLVTPSVPAAKAPAKCAATASFSWQLVSRYLGTQPTWTGDQLRWGQAQLPRLQASTGGYQLSPAQALGYQILLKYRSPVARQVSLMDVLTDRLDPQWVKDRIVLVGMTAPSVKDIFKTPYSNHQTDSSSKMAGILLHAQMTSQLLSAVTEGRSLFWTLPDWGEWLWAGGWSLLGGGLALRFRRLRSLGGGLMAALGSLMLINVGIFSQSGWLPLAPPLFGMLLTSASVVGHFARQNARQQRQMLQKLREQESMIAVLQTLLRQPQIAENETVVGTTIVDRLSNSTLLHQRYRVTTLLGKGGFSQTYLAEDTQLPSQPLCVVKHLRPARSDPQFLILARRLFKTEADILGLLGQHTQIPQLLAYFEEQQEFYLIQEYIPGVPLETALKSGRQSEGDVITLLAEVLKILVFVHSYGVIHRDLKPSNLICRTDGHMAMIDFGAVKQIPPQLREEENFTVAIGTLGYAPPEQFMGQPRFNSDIYALGMIAIQALTGTAVNTLQRDPAGGLAWQHLASVSQPLAAVLDRMIAYDFHQRYVSATEVLQALAKL
jgi:CHASE2 domain-containing sensor protein/predicted Ser/Thr protein kinase